MNERAIPCLTVLPALGRSAIIEIAFLIGAGSVSARYCRKFDCSKALLTAKSDAAVSTVPTRLAGWD